MPRLKVNNYIFYRELQVSKEEILYDTWRKGSFHKDNLIPDIENELIVNRASNEVPPHQTKTDLYPRMKGRKHWDDLYNKIKHSLLRYYTKEFTLWKSWANVAKENNRFGNHTHPCDLTVVYYLKCDLPVYGTYIVDENIMIPAVNDSLLIFKPNIEHRLTNMPFELAVHPHNHRYSIVFDFNIDKSKTT